MFRLVEAISSDPVRFPIKPGIKMNPGSIVKLVEYNGFLVADLCDGYSPLGILGNKCIGTDNIDLFNTAEIYPQRMIADVGVFDKKGKIKSGCSLYCNKYGFLSTKKTFESSTPLAKVITPPSKKNKYMQILWL